MKKQNWKKNILKMFFFAIVTFTIIFSACSSNYKEGKKILAQLTRQEKKDLRNFFYNVLLKSPGIYVLHGSKPLSHTLIRSNPSKKEFEELCSKLPPQLVRQTFYKKPSWKDILWGYCFNASKPFYPQQWERVKQKIKLTNYLIAIRPELNRDDPFTKSLFFVNITNTIALFQKHYAFFKQLVGFDFDPLEMIYDLENPASVFWQKIEYNYIAWGLLFGFGEENALFFTYWSNGLDRRSGRALDYFRYAPFDSSGNRGLFLRRGLDYHHFSLPVFRHFENDPVLEKYKKEREKIKKLYRGRDPLVVTLQKLTEKKTSIPFKKLVIKKKSLKKEGK